MPEVSDQELSLLRESKRVFDAIYGDPDHGLDVKKALKKVRPDISIPELDAQSALAPAMDRVNVVADAVAKLTERLDNDAQERQQAAAADKLARDMARARDRYKLTDDGIAGMTALMQEKGIMDPADAAELYVARQPKPQLASQRTGRFGQATYADVTGYANEAEKQKLLIESPERFLAAEVEQILAEFDSEAA